MSETQETPPAPPTRSIRRAWIDWHAAWSQLPPNRKVSHAMLHALVLTFAAAGGLACFVAVTHRQVGSLPGRVALDAIVCVLVLAMVVRDPLMPDARADDGFSSTFAHRGAGVLAIAVLPWVGFAGLVGADLSTRPDFYAQIAQIIPVLLLAVIVERRFLPNGRARPTEDERYVLRAGFVLLVVGPVVAELLALLAIASHLRWIEATTTLLAASTIPALLVLLATPLALALYEPAPTA